MLNRFYNKINNHRDRQGCKSERSDLIREILSKIGVIIRSESSELRKICLISPTL